MSPLLNVSAVEVRDLTKRFGSLIAVDRLSLSVLPGEIFGIVGPDGAGKTTTMRMMAGVMRPDSGQVKIDQIDAISHPNIVKQHLSYMPQRFGLYEDLTVDENIRFYADLFGISADLREDRAKRLLAASGMNEFRKRRAGQLSGGMKQKLGLTCSLIHTPNVLLLDEPTTGVDPVSRRDFWRILYELREGGVSIIISTAYLDEAERCHRLALLHHGRLLHCDTPAKLRTYMRGALLSIATSDPRAAQIVAAKNLGVKSTLLMGDAVHVAVDEAEKRKSELEAALRAATVPFENISRISPTIEDLFVNLDETVEER